MGFRYQVLLSKDFNTIPVGLLGNDKNERKLYHEMQEVGLDLNHIHFSKKYKILFSFCFIYPDGSCANLTLNDLACTKIKVKHLENLKNEFVQYKEEGIVLAVPEVPFDPAHEKEIFKLEAQFQELEEKYKDFPKGKRMSPVAAEESCNTLIWECEFDSTQKAYEALDFFKNNDEHEKLFEK